ncbi:MAG: MopE-related protein, partial [Saprospiraceae bacterium]
TKITISGGATLINNSSLTLGNGFNSMVISGTVLNSGTITFGGVLINWGGILTNGGTLTSNNSNAYALNCQGTFANNGTFNVSNTASNGLINSGTMTLSGTTNINSVGERAIINNASSALNISGSVTVNSNSLYNGLDNNGFVEVLTTGTLQFNGSYADPTKSISNNTGANFINSGITIDMIGNGTFLSNLGTFANYPCGKLTVRGVITNSNGFYNHGFIINESLVLHSNFSVAWNLAGCIQNNTQTFSPFFTYNTGYYIVPISGTYCNTDVVYTTLIGYGNDLFVENNRMYKDVALTVEAGIFDPNSNSITLLPSSAGASTFYMKINDSNEGCGHVFKIIFDHAITVPPTWYRDMDADFYGDPLVTIVDCQQPMGYVSNSLDCDDTNPNRHPNAYEVCNGIDDDCDGIADTGSPTTSTWNGSVGDNLWSSVGNWTPGAKPNFCSNVVIPSNNTYHPNVDVTAGVHSIDIGASTSLTLSSPLTVRPENSNFGIRNASILNIGDQSIDIKRSINPLSIGVWNQGLITSDFGSVTIEDVGTGIYNQKVVFLRNAFITNTGSHAIHNNSPDSLVFLPSGYSLISHVGGNALYNQSGKLILDGYIDMANGLQMAGCIIRNSGTLWISELCRILMPNAAPPNTTSGICTDPGSTTSNYGDISFYGHRLILNGPFINYGIITGNSF